MIVNVALEALYIHEEGRSNGVIDSWNGNGDLQAILICKSIYRVACLGALPGDDLDTVSVVGYNIRHLVIGF